MKGYMAYQMHNAFNLHFGKGNYDYFKYNGQTRVNKDSFAKNRFKWQYTGIEKKVDGRLIEFYYLCYKNNGFKYCTSQMIFNYGRIYKATTIETLRGQLESDLEYLKHKYSDDITQIYSIDGLYPNLYTEYKNKKIEIETLLLIDGYVKQLLTKNYSNDIIAWPDICKHMMQIQPFVMSIFDRDWFIKSFTNLFLERDNK